MSFLRTLSTSGTFRASFGSKGDLSTTAARTQESQRGPSMDSRRGVSANIVLAAGTRITIRTCKVTPSIRLPPVQAASATSFNWPHTVRCSRTTVWSFVTFSFRVFVLSLGREVGLRVTVLVSNHGHGGACFCGSRVLSISFDVHSLAVCGGLHKTQLACSISLQAIGLASRMPLCMRCRKEEDGGSRVYRPLLTSAHSSARMDMEHTYTHK